MSTGNHWQVRNGGLSAYHTVLTLDYTTDKKFPTPSTSSARPYLPQPKGVKLIKLLQVPYTLLFVENRKIYPLVLQVISPSKGNAAATYRHTHFLQSILNFETLQLFPSVRTIPLDSQTQPSPLKSIRMRIYSSGPL